MTKRLWIDEAPDDPTIEDIVWRRAADGPSSLHTNIDPDLARLGDVRDANRDALWLAITVFLADRTSPRRRGWERNLEIAVPVGDPENWKRARPDLVETLSFLSSDTWTVDFVAAPEPAADGEGGTGSDDGAEVDLACLFSGGADSMCGAIRALTEDHRVILISHWDWSVHAGIQKRLVAELQKLFGVDIAHMQVNVGRSSKQIGGATFPDEPSRRSRSLLFVTLGLAVASSGEAVPMWIAENGFASLNPPLAPERRASLSTRTTHPTFLANLQELLRRVGAHTDFSNPFAALTKGEMFASARKAIGSDAASQLLSKTHSCSHARWAGMFGRSPDTHCGVCFGCLVRRGAFIASGLEDRTTYLVDDLTNDERGRFLTPVVRAHIESARYAVNRSFGPADVLAMDLPTDHDLDAALDLVRRGFSELAAVELP